MSAELVVAVDVGGTKTAAAAVERDGSIGDVVNAPTRAAEGPGAVIDVIAGLVQRVRDHAGERRLAALGVGSAGIVDARSGTILGANDTFPGWPGTPVGPLLSQRLGVPVHVQNDVDAHAAGEAWIGAAAGSRTALVVAIGTGVGSALVIDGVPLVGGHHAQGEMGHVPSALAAGLVCPCGRIGHLEAVACGPAIAVLQGAAHEMATGERSVFTTPEVLRLADGGDVVAREVVLRAGQALGQAIAGTVTVIDPDVVVLGGGVAGRSKLWWQAVEGTLRAELVPALQDVALRLSSLGGLAPLAGAGRAGWRIADEEHVS